MIALIKRNSTDRFLETIKVELPISPEKAIMAVNDGYIPVPKKGINNDEHIIKLYKDIHLVDTDIPLDLDFDFSLEDVNNLAIFLENHINDHTVYEGVLMEPFIRKSMTPEKVILFTEHSKDLIEDHVLENTLVSVNDIKYRINKIINRSLNPITKVAHYTKNITLENKFYVESNNSIDGKQLIDWNYDELYYIVEDIMLILIEIQKSKLI